MTRQQQLEFCNVCKNRAFRSSVGTICGLTSEAPTFYGTCQSYIADEHEIINLTQQKEEIKAVANKSVNKGRYALFIIGGIFAIAGISEAFFIEGHNLIYGYIDWFISAVFLGLGIWSFRKASLAMIIGFSFYILFNVLLAFLNPATIVSGIIWKILVTVYLIYGIKSAREEEAKIKETSFDLLDQV